MDLNSKAYFKLSNSDCNRKYERIRKALSFLEKKHDHETLEM